MTENRVLSGRYRITSHLARGGMADVFQAEDISLGRTVAIKILHPQFSADDAFVTRFRREAQAAANLSHPNIVSIYDFGEDGDTYYMVMELIAGRTLRDIRRSDGALLPRRAGEIAAEAAAALTVAHQAGVYHRDVKPGNIMLTSDGSVKVTDFGIARALDDSEELTRTGAVIGTATYFSPEQAQGLPADDRSDVYSLGVVLYELVCGQPPFTGESPVAVAYQHVSEFAPSPSRINADVPPTLEAIIERAMEKDPAERYQTAEDMRADLLRFLAGEVPVAAVLAEPSAPSPPAATQIMPAPPPATVPPAETARAVAAGHGVSRSQASYVAVIVGLLAALAVGIFLLTRILSTSDPVVVLATVPDLSARAYDDALEELQNLDLKIRQRDEVSDSVPAGFIISTEPPAGTEVEPKSFVTLVRSSGPQQFAIPNLLGVDEASARERIESDLFVVGRVEYRFDESVEEGSVIDQSPPPGLQAAEGAEVSLIVSTGPFALTMPDVSNRTQEAAELELSRIGFTNVIIEEVFSDEVLGKFVISTQPGASQLVGRAATITLFVSKGPEPFAAPNLVGKTRTEAITLAEDAGLLLVVLDDTVEVTAVSELEGKIARQQPVAGAEVLPNDEVRVELGVLRQVVVPPLLSLSEAQADVELEALGLFLQVTGQTEVSEESGLEGFIATQEPAAGSSVPDGSMIRVTLGVLPPPTTTTTTTTTTLPPTTTTLPPTTTTPPP